ncbi:3'-5' exonuclease [Geotoga petraea]|jgi:DNA polymerase-3 subunit epsilon|uniref:3'-5' exonuclease n=1 Tax=Geotoga petraea TaxID=28234 RepID=A0A1G6HSH8_9BACT|nr:3'-5' exonuclease [Geotoga petraea]TGG88919.1 3'-5' exonuclease [Geotoga petraea]SDB96446.1 DNA polymerase-3 subunit epsilon [Geotoga petraea]
MKDFLVFDTETTGLHPGNICQLSYIINNEKEEIAKNFFFTVDYIEPGAKRVHGFTEEKLIELSGGSTFKDFLPEIEEDFKRVDTIIAHNINFDLRFLKAEFENYGKEFNYNNSMCSMRRFTDICKIPNYNNRGLGRFKWPSLFELTKFMGIKRKDLVKETKRLFKDPRSKFHDARYDTVAVYLSIIKALDQKLI